MYTAYLDGKIIYSPLMVAQKIISSDAKITYEINKAGSFTFTIPVMHPEYNNFKKLKSIITVKDDDGEIWRGRVIDTTKDFYNNKKIVCEGELAFLNDGLIEPYDYSDSGITVGQMLNKYISSYRTNCPTERDIRLGMITAVNSSTVIYPKSESYATILPDMISTLVDVCGGYLHIRRSNNISYLDYLNMEINLSDQQITFGVNLLDLEEYVNAADVYTYLIPLGKKDDDGNPLTIESVNGGSNYIKSVDGEKLYGKIERCITWDNITNANLLKTTAQEELSKAIQEVTSIEITAVDLKLLGADVDSIEVGQYVTVISPPHDIHDNFLCSKIELNLLQPSNSVYTFGVTRSSMTETQAGYSASIKDTHITTDWLQAAINNATAMMTGSKGGYKVTEYDEHGRWLRDLYMNAPNKEDATLVMQINMNGIGFSREGFDGPYKNAWTIDGTLLGEFIKAGSVQSEALSAEYKQLVTKEINTTVTSKFQVAENLISAEVTRATNQEIELAAAIQITSEQINQKVSKGDVSSQLSLEAGQITLSGPRLKIDTEKFKLDVDGACRIIGGYLETSDNTRLASMWGGCVYFGDKIDGADAGLLSFQRSSRMLCIGGYGSYGKLGLGYWAGNDQFSPFITIESGYDRPGIQLNTNFSVIGKEGITEHVEYMKPDGSKGWLYIWCGIVIQNE